MTDETGGPGRFVPGAGLAPVAALALPVAFLDGGTGLGLGLAAAYDAALLAAGWLESRGLGRHPVTVERHMDARLVVGVPNEVRLKLHNPSATSVRLRLRDTLPAGWRAEPDELTVTLPGYARRELTYTVTPERRGQYDFGDLHVRLEGRTRLGARLRVLPAKQTARVYPNVLGPKRYDLAARLGGLAGMGVRPVRRSGGGGEFEQLRLYVPGDSYRDVDWKSTAKRQRPVTRVFEQERSQRVLLAIDAGRMMAPRLTDGGISKLDHAVNAALLLAYVALRQDDRVGLVVFADQVAHFVAPGKGPAQYRRLLDVLYAVQASETYVDFRRLVEFLQVRAPRRSLLVMFSDLLDEAQAGPLARHVGILSRKHLTVCVTMRDPVAEGLADGPAARPSEVYRRAAAADLLDEREGLKLRLQKGGVGLVEAPANDLAVATVNRYLEIKARRAL